MAVFPSMMPNIPRHQFGKDEYCEGRWWDRNVFPLPKGAKPPYKKTILCGCCKTRWPIKDFFQIDTRYTYTQWVNRTNESECKRCAGKHPESKVGFLC